MKTFKESLWQHELAIQAEEDERPFNFLTGGAFITRGVSGKYEAYFNGKFVPAVADGLNGMDTDGFFHFSLSDNPLG